MAKWGNLLSKTLVIGIIILFIGMSVVSSTGHYIKRISSEQEQLVVFENTISRYNDVFEAYAHAPYWPEGQEGLYGFDLDTPGTLELITSEMNILSGACFVPPCYIYFKQYANGILWIFDIITLELNSIGGGGGGGKNGMDYDDESGYLYTVGERGLYKIDKDTGEQDYIGNWGSSHLIIAIAINEGIAYGHDVVNDAIYIINLDTAELTLLGETGLDSYIFGSDMAFDKDNDTLYLTSYNSSYALYTCNTGNGNCTLVGDFEGGAEVTALAIPYNINQPPYAPTIDGPMSGNPNTEYEFTFNATDPEGDDVKYHIDWGDESSEMTDFNPSGTDVKVKHTWSEKGTYNITAKAQDIHYAKGPAGTLTVSMPRNKATTYSLFQLFFDRFPLLEVFLRTITMLR